MSEHMDYALMQEHGGEQESSGSELLGVAARNGSPASPTQEIEETFAGAVGNSIFHGSGSAGVPSGLNGGGGQVGGVLETSSDRAQAR